MTAFITVYGSGTSAFTSGRMVRVNINQIEYYHAYTEQSQDTKAKMYVAGGVLNVKETPEQLDAKIDTVLEAIRSPNHV